MNVGGLITEKLAPKGCHRSPKLADDRSWEKWGRTEAGKGEQSHELMNQLDSNWLLLLDFKRIGPSVPYLTHAN